MRPSTTLLAIASLFFAHDAARGEGGDWEEFQRPTAFTRMTASVGGVKAATASSPAHATSSRIAALADGGALVIDADSGALIRTNASGAAVAKLAIAGEAGLLAYDDVAKRAYVADRRGDKIAVVAVGDGLEAIASWKTPAEPYGVALTPDRKALLVTTIADRTLVAFDVANGAELWRTPLAAEPRGIAVSPDGTRAVVASLMTGVVEQIALDDKPLVRRVALPIDTDGQRARGAFAVTFVGTMAVAPYQLHVPVPKSLESTGHYGGSFTPPIAHAIAWLGADGRQSVGRTNVNEPRALAWDRERDILYVVGLAADRVAVVTKASQLDANSGGFARLGPRCGADGIALASDGDVLVWCSFTRSVARLELGKHGKLGKLSRGPELAPPALDAKLHEGFVLFHTASERISSFAGMSCGNCHLDGRADGLSWTINRHALQTPILAGRVKDTGPFKWDGKAADLAGSVRATIGRLGGFGITKKQIAALTAYVESIPAVRAPTRHADSIARGKQLFESGDLGCLTCHDGPAYTDRDTHELVNARGAFDTPSLRGLAASAPYFHDGSAATLDALLRDRGKLHGMSAGATKLTDAQLADLIAFLETL